jgi:hypothetical protein
MPIIVIIITILDLMSTYRQYMRRKCYFSAIFFLTTNSEFKMMCETSIVIILVNRDDIDDNVPAMKLTTGIWMVGKALRIGLKALQGRKLANRT